MTRSSKHKVQLLFDGQYGNATLVTMGSEAEPGAVCNHVQHVKPPIHGGTEKAEQEGAITALTSPGMMEKKKEESLPLRVSPLWMQSLICTSTLPQQSSFLIF